MNLLYFTELEAATLTALYGRIDDWWHYFYILSDALEEREEPLVADFMRWLTPQRQRPWQRTLDDNVWQWWTAPTTNSVKLGRIYTGFSNYLDDVFSSVSGGYTDRYAPGQRILYLNPIAAIEAVARLWTTFSPYLRRYLWKQYTEIAQ